MNIDHVRSPKQKASVTRSSWYRYYAGYSPRFVEDVLDLVQRDDSSAHVLDPWMGAGTTLAVARDRGCYAIGVDINPALVVIAKARLLGRDVHKSLRALTEEVLEGARRNPVEARADEPLVAWFGPQASAYLRSIERSIFRLLVDPGSPASPVSFGVNRISCLAAFFYVALFRVTRSRLRHATTSNPTWLKARVPSTQRAKPSLPRLEDEFRAAQAALAGFVGSSRPADGADDEKVSVEQGSSTALNVASRSVDAIVASPPYCTRIDYVAAVRVELALLGCDNKIQKALRHLTLGNPTVPEGFAAGSLASSPTAASFLSSVANHATKASSGYYLRYFQTYFRMLDQSLREMWRVTRDGGKAFLVVQDSYYKNVHLDLPRATAELAAQHGWLLDGQRDFRQERTLAAINPRVRVHRSTFDAVESVLVLRRTSSQ